MFIVGMKVNIIASIDVILMFLSITHQTFVLIRPDQGVLKISFVFIFRRRLQDALKTSSRRLSQDQYIRLGHMSSRRLQDVFKTFSRHFQDVLQKRLEDISKTSYKDAFQTLMYHQVKLFAQVTLPKNLWLVQEIFKCDKIQRNSIVLVFLFTTTSSGYLQRHFQKLVEHLQGSFFAKILNGFKRLTIFEKKAASQMSDWVENRSVAKGLKH